MVLMVCAKRRVARWLLSLFSDVPCNKILRVSYIESSGARMVEILERIRVFRKSTLHL